jgi:hypothetical protein
VRCGRCGNENAEGNRFCGMCGTPLVPKAQAHVPVAPSTVRREDPVRAPEEIRVPGPVASDAVPETASPSVSRTVVAPPAPIGISAARSVTPPVVTPPVVTPPPPIRADSGPAVYGPSFLGLNRPPDGRSGDGLQAGTGNRSGNLDYLLEDEEEPKRGWGKLLVVVIALGLIGGFGYLRWKQGGFNFLKLGAGTQASQKAMDSSGAPSATGATPAAPSADSSNGASQNSGAGNPANTGTTGATPSTTDSTANGNVSPGPGNNSSPGADAGAQPTAPSGALPAAAAPDNSSAAKPQEDAAAGKSSESDSAEDTEAGPAKAESHAAPSPTAPAATKPSAARTRERKPTPVTPVDTTAEAERYIYGRGVPQDCDVGLRMLKPAAQTNPKAMITLGTLYSSGTCTPRDLPTAYRWFAMALHKQPDNQTLQDDLQQLWSQMTPPERQLAIKLSQ